MEAEIRTIWNQFHDELNVFVQNMVKSRMDADDIVQEAFVKIMQNMDKVMAAKNLKQYLYTIVKNSTMDFFRRKKNIGELNDDRHVFQKEDEVELNHTIADCCITPFVNKLPPIYREALLISELQNVSQKELAKRLNISYSGAKSRVQRGKQMLRKLLVDCCAFESDNYGNVVSGGCQQQRCD